MNTNQFDQERLAIVGAAFEAGYMLGKFGKIGAVNDLQYESSPDITPEARTIIHRVPSVPIILDGEKAPPERVKEFDGRPLYYLLDSREPHGGVLQVFSTMERLHEYRNGVIAGIKRRTGQGSDGALRMEVTPAGSPFVGEVGLYEHKGWRGRNWWFSAMDGFVPDFTKCWNWFLPLNDKASSLDTDVYVNVAGWYWPVYTLLYEHIDYEGSVWWIENPQEIESFVPYGWNDRASSMSYWSSNY